MITHIDIEWPCISWWLTIVVFSVDIFLATQGFAQQTPKSLPLSSFPYTLGYLEYLPPNYEIENYDPSNPDPGLLSHTDPSALFNPADPNATPFAGQVKTPTLRNVDKRRGNSFTKAYMHNGYFKSLEQVVHFYNTASLLRDPLACPAGTTASQAMAENCWPAPEFDTPNQAENSGVIGNMGLTADEEAAIVAYLKTLTDTVTPKQPQPFKASK